MSYLHLCLIYIYIYIYILKTEAHSPFWDLYIYRNIPGVEEEDCELKESKFIL